MAWSTPKIDWAISDYYNAADLNRVEGNTDYLATYITANIDAVTVSSIKTDWAKTDIISKTDLTKVETNIQACRDTFDGDPTGWQTLKTSWASLDKFDYIDANRLETDLGLLKTMAENVVAAYLNCGNFICGEGTEL